MSKARESYSISHAVNSNSIVLAVKGNINEAFDTNLELDRVAQTFRNAGEDLPLVLDLGRVGRLNSVGIRHWCRFIAELQNKYPISFSKLSESFVELAGSVESALGQGPVEIQEFDVPYFCSECQDRFVIAGNALEVDSNGRWTGPLETPCPKCGKTGRFDSVEREYFKFLSHMKPAA